MSEWKSLPPHGHLAQTRPGLLLRETRPPYHSLLQPFFSFQLPSWLEGGKKDCARLLLLCNF